MPAQFEQTFPVRFYECDAYGHVNHANYLRYMQEAAFAASADVGYDAAKYEAMDRQWLIRETDITYLRPFQFGDTVHIKTWVSDFRRVRSRRAYELRNEETGELMAEAHTDWVYIDTKTKRPSTVPEAMRLAFMPEGAPEQAVRRDPFPTAPPPPPGIYALHRDVEWQDIDPAQHVNNAMYMAYIEACGIGVAAHHGWPMTRMMDEGFGIVARRYRIEYRQPAVMGNALTISTWLSEVKRATAVRHYTITRDADQALLARAHVLWVWINLVNGRPIRIPPHFISEFQTNIA